jgi:(4S)-4-hydroxy-5-phosphonooxypentane-2,3-dione isomerase
MSRFVIVVEFTLHAGVVDQFMPLMLANAKASLANERGCERFDVLHVAGQPHQIVLYEIYRDKAAFQEHLKTRHFLEFNSASAPHIKEKKIVELAYLNDTGA